MCPMSQVLLVMCMLSARMQRLKGVEVGKSGVSQPISQPRMAARVVRTLKGDQNLFEQGSLEATTVVSNPSNTTISYAFPPVGF